MKIPRFTIVYATQQAFLFLLMVFLVALAVSSSTAQAGPIAQSYDPPNLVCPQGYNPVVQLPNGNPEGIWLSSNPANSVAGGVTGYDAGFSLAEDTSVVLTVWTGLGHPEEDCALGGTSWLCGLPHQPDERYEIWFNGSLIHTTSDWGEHFWAYDANLNLGTVSAGNHSFHLEHADLDMNNPTSSVFFFVGVCAEDAPPPPDEDQGCTPGYWRQDHHYDDWTGYTPNLIYSSVFGVGPDVTLGEAVALNGGGENALARHSVAALLNAANPDVNYPYSEAQVIQMTQDAFNGGDVEGTKDLFDAANNLGCPLGNGGQARVSRVLGFTDGRTNRFDAGAPVALFSFTKNGALGIVVYSPFNETLLIVDPETIAAVPVNPAENTLLGANEERGVYFYRLTTGEFQLNARTAEGKTYTLIFPVIGGPDYRSFEEWIR